MRSRRESFRGLTGLTLVELVIVSLLGVVIGGGLLSALQTGQRSTLSADLYVQVQQEARRAFNGMVSELRETRMSAGNPITVLGNGAIQLNFQIARGYNLNAADPACPVNAVCWGNENQADGWIHYAIIGNAGNQRQLVRCVDTIEAQTITVYNPATCQVFANSVKHPNDANSAAFIWNAASREVTINLQVEYIDTGLPEGRLTSPLLESSVRLRNI